MSGSTNYGTGSLNTNTGANNSAFGFYAGYSNTDASCNTAVGADALVYTTSGPHNTAIGAGSMCSNILGQSNTAVGSGSLAGNPANGSGNENVAIGAKALYSNYGNYNIGVGCYALQNNTIGGANTAVGYQALQANNTQPTPGEGINNSAFGFQALNNNTSGIANTAIGAQAGYDLSGNYNTFLGAGTDVSSNTITYNYSTALGYQATINASNQIVLGTSNEKVKIPGSYVGIGGVYNPSIYTLDVSGILHTNADALINGVTVGVGGGNVTGNTAVGVQALQSNTTINNGGFSNTAVGFLALQANTDGIYNTALGFEALYSKTTGGLNTAIGLEAGYKDISGNYNTFLGASTDVDISSNTYSNSTALGYNATIDASNQIVLGGLPVGGSYPNVKIPGSYVGIGGVYDPSSSYVLDVSGNVNASNYLTNYSSLPTFTSNMIGHSYSSPQIIIANPTYDSNGVAITNFTFPSLGVYLVNFTVSVVTSSSAVNNGTSNAGIKASALTSPFVNGQYVEFPLPTYQYNTLPPFFESSGSFSLTINISSTTTTYYITNQTTDPNFAILNLYCYYNYVKIA